MFTLPKLDYNYDGLEPYIDAQTMELHYSKHHQAYIDKLNAALDGTDWVDKSIEEILHNLESLPEKIRTSVRNNGGGHYNHSLFWKMMKSGGSGQPTGKIAAQIDSTFGSFEKFKQDFEAAAVARFGSGWVWLTKKNDELIISSSPNQDCPVMEGIQPILALDVWEHAYYLKYQNRRPEYISNWWNVVDWDYVEELFEQ